MSSILEKSSAAAPAVQVDVTSHSDTKTACADAPFGSAVVDSSECTQTEESHLVLTDAQLQVPICRLWKICV
jgi:hypothetical protein